MANKKTNVQNRINKQKEIEQKKRKKRKRILIILVVLVLLGGICAYLLQAEKFNIQEIIIEGNEQLTQESIYEISEIKLGDNIFSTISIVAKVRLKENGYIEDVNIKKIYPNKIKIEIKERNKQYQILTKTGCYIYIDEQGYIIDYSLEKLENLITITGMELTEPDIKEIYRLQEKDLNKMENILHIIDEKNKSEITNIINQIDTEDEYIMHLDNDKIIVNFGDATNLSDRMFYVKAILKEEGENSGKLYVNGNINEGFKPYFRAN